MINKESKHTTRGNCLVNKKGYKMEGKKERKDLQ
jgi:hypothetical protein